MGPTLYPESAGLLTSIINIFSSVVVDNLYFQFHKHDKIGIACLYADYKDQTNQTVPHILGSFLRQFLTSVPEPIPDEVIQKLEDIHHGGRKAETVDILVLLKIRLQQLKCSFICIDAVDELEPKARQQLLNILKELNTNKNTRLFFTGRGHIETEVQQRFGDAQRYDVSANHQDIRGFVRQQIKEDHDLNPEAMDNVLAKCIEDAIVEKSKGM